MSPFRQEPAPAPDVHAQTGLFVIWERSRGEQDRILADLAEHFSLPRVYEVHWTPARIAQNFQRFYSDSDVLGTTHQQQRGSGPFLAVLAVDQSPRVELRETSRGTRAVNAHFLDAKVRYRAWTDALGVHCGESERETSRDIAMLLGDDIRSLVMGTAPCWDRRIEVIKRDVVAADGWTSWSQLFVVLNEAAHYLVLSDGDPTTGRAVDGGPIELLTDQYRELYTILGARARHGAPPAWGGDFVVCVRSAVEKLRIRHVEDHLLDPRWSADLLERRELDPGGWFRCGPADAHVVRGYRLLMHAPRLPPDSARALVDAARVAGLEGWSEAAVVDPARAKALVEGLLERPAYRVVRPRDHAVFFHHGRLGGPRAPVRRAADAFRAGASRIGRACIGPVGAGYRALRAWAPGAESRTVRARSAAGAPGRRMTEWGWKSIKTTLRYRSRRLVLLLRGALHVGLARQCPCCGWRFRSFVARESLFASSVDGYCPRCNVKARHRRDWLYMTENTDVCSAPLRLLHVSPVWGLARRLRGMTNIRYHALDLRRTGEYVDMVGDVADIPACDARFDAIVCIHVLEHVTDDARAIAELFRVLRPGGWALITVPIRLDQPTYEDPMITEPADRALHFGDETHVRYYGGDLQDKLAAAGFEVCLDRGDALADAPVVRYALRRDEHVFHCVRPKGRGQSEAHRHISSNPAGRAAALLAPDGGSIA